MSHSPSSLGHRLARLLILPLLFALCSALFSGNAERLHARLLWLGESLFTGYFQLQSDPKPPPNCDELFKEQENQQPDQEEEDLDDLFGEEEDPSTQNQKSNNADDELEALFGEEEDSDKQKNQLAEAQRKAKEACEADQIAFVQINKRITTSVRFFRGIEGGISTFIAWVVEHFKHFLAFIFILGALIASMLDEHIALRPAETNLSLRLRAFCQMIAFGVTGLSTWYYRALLSLPEERSLNLVWLIGLSFLTLWHAYQLILPAKSENSSNASIGNDLSSVLLSIPLFAVMGLIAGIYFFTVGHPTGLAIELTKLTEHAILYVNVALYVWVGMLLKQSSISTMVFDLLRPLKLEPSILAAVVVVGAAIPTAYSGASGIFVIAAGALIYDELRKAGARRHLALAATAMSGSLGVVLSPCLLVVIIASLNKQVTTDELYSWGVWVFILTAFLFVMTALSQRDRTQAILGRPFAEARPDIAQAFRRLIGPVITMIIVLAFYWLILDTVVDEHSAPMVLPVLLMLLLWRESRVVPPQTLDTQSLSSADSDSTSSPTHLSTKLGKATAEAGPHIGALLSLMGLSICVGGVIERAELMSFFPESFASIWLAMTALVIILVIIGMSMDPYGAVILVSATIADVAYQSGINPVHFWMVVLVAFELGYLSPPVALNHLLTRQVVGEEEFIKAELEVKGFSFWKRYERILLPLLVMGIALVIVAYGPLFFY
ncbi:MAG: C4-dicarboxylate ABC transporter [Myxococcales bacterium]|nr:C4-dicarboxylate ABC transporter [Myxococcales bacterium]